jgi:hypothetical protein
MEMAMENIRKEILKIRRELVRVEQRLRIEREFSTYSKVDVIRNELKREFPSLDFDDDLLELVGRLPYNPVKKDREVIREAVEWSIE